jgi:hypothetical protein
MDSLHRYMLLALGRPVPIFETRLLAQHQTSVTVVPPPLVGVCYTCGRDGTEDTAYAL